MHGHFLRSCSYKSLLMLALIVIVLWENLHEILVSYQVQQINSLRPWVAIYVIHSYVICTSCRYIAIKYYYVISCILSI